MSSPLIGFTEFCNPAAVRTSGHTWVHFSSNKHTYSTVYTVKKTSNACWIPMQSGLQLLIKWAHWLFIKKGNIILIFNTALEAMQGVHLQLVLIMSQITSWISSFFLMKYRCRIIKMFSPQSNLLIYQSACLRSLQTCIQTESWWGRTLSAPAAPVWRER